jgi:hypothetical protein
LPAISVTLTKKGTIVEEGGVIMKFWKRTILTLAAMLIASFVVGLIWRLTFDVRIPSYLSGLVGGLAALAIWEFLRSE